MALIPSTTDQHEYQQALEGEKKLQETALGYLHCYELSMVWPHVAIRY